MMEEFRHNTPKEINHSLVKRLPFPEATDLQTGEKTHLDFETKSDVLQFFLADGKIRFVLPVLNRRLNSSTSGFELR